MKVFITLCIFLLMAGVAAAQNVSGTIPCVDGGSGTYTGTYNILTGEVALNVTLSDCEGVSGTVATSGTLQFASGTTVNVNLAIDSQLTTEAGAALNCHQTVAGTFNLETSVLSGNAGSNCNASGSIGLSVTDLLFGSY
ncbi:MAG: hypothetical protein HZA17_11380 [Nitrospirae bacterium]|nr:hypothetical protein [Nitrospirota bacterium]